MNDTEQFAVRGACVWLLDHFAKERTKSYRRALAIWTHWQASSFAANLNSVIEER
jgi:CHAD domain-containing protein